MDVYKIVAEEKGVSRADVKAVSFPILYGSGAFQKIGDTLDAIRATVDAALELGLIKKVDKP